MLQISTWLKFRVRTLDERALTQAAAQLAALARDFQPHLLVGIRSGGWRVAELMAKALPEAVLLPLTCRRASTQKKQSSGMLKKLLRRLPYCITNPLRIMEHIALTQLRPAREGSFTPDAAEIAAIQSFLNQHSGNVKILIADDAVDSGATLKAVYEALRAAAPGASIKTAAITVTTTAPLLQPDFALYRYVLCRFPWSLDFKS